EKNGQGMLGKKGDWYFFFNDTWHGRQPNLSGKRLMMVRFGGFATDFTFPEDIPRPQFPDHLPESLRYRYSIAPPKNTQSDSILQRMKARQQFLDMFIQSNHEKRRAAR